MNFMNSIQTSGALYYIYLCVGRPGGSKSKVVGLPNNPYKPITNTAWFHARLCELQKGCTRLAAASDKVYQLLLRYRLFPPLKLVAMI
jgi:hypothetical protein